METQKLQTETVYSKANDSLVKTDLVNSKIWDGCIHPDDIKGVDLTGWWKHSIKFSGVTPVQHINATQI